MKAKEKRKTQLKNSAGAKKKKGRGKKYQQEPEEEKALVGERRETYMSKEEVPDEAEEQEPVFINLFGHKQKVYPKDENLSPEKLHLLKVNKVSKKRFFKHCQIPPSFYKIEEDADDFPKFVQTVIREEETEIKATREKIPMSIKDVRKTTSVLLREARIVLKQEEEEQKKMLDLLEGCTSVRLRYEQLLEAERHREQEMFRLKLDKLHILGQLTYERALLARKHFIEESARRRKLYEIEREALEKDLAIVRQQHELKVKELVKKAHDIDERLKQSKEKLLSSKKKEAQALSEQIKQMIDDAMKKQQEELENKVITIQKLRTLQAIRKGRKRKKVIGTVQHGLLCEMSLDELKDRLRLTKLKLKVETADRRTIVRRNINRKKKVLKNIETFIENVRESWKNRSDDVEKENCYKIKNVKEILQRNEEISVLKEELQKAKNENLLSRKRMKSTKTLRFVKTKMSSPFQAEIPERKEDRKSSKGEQKIKLVIGEDFSEPQTTEGEEPTIKEKKGSKMSSLTKKEIAKLKLSLKKNEIRGKEMTLEETMAELRKESTTPHTEAEARITRSSVICEEIGEATKGKISTREMSTPVHSSVEEFQADVLFTKRQLPSNFELEVPALADEVKEIITKPYYVPSEDYVICVDLSSRSNQSGTEQAS